MDRPMPRLPPATTTRLSWKSSCNLPVIVNFLSILEAPLLLQPDVLEVVLALRVRGEILDDRPGGEQPILRDRIGEWAIAVDKRLHLRIERLPLDRIELLAGRQH